MSKNRMMHDTVVRCYHDGIIWYNVLPLDEKDSLTTVECAANIGIQLQPFNSTTHCVLDNFFLTCCKFHRRTLDCQPP